MKLDLTVLRRLMRCRSLSLVAFDAQIGPLDRFTPSGRVSLCGKTHEIGPDALS